MAKRKVKVKKRRGEFNRNQHPELLPGEVFITNASDEDDGDGSSYSNIGWKTKRRGSIAYDINGKRIAERGAGLFPVFVEKSEIRAAGNGILKLVLSRTQWRAS